MEPITLNEPRFLKLLEALIGESKHVQNNPAQGLIPREDLICEHIEKLLRPHSKENGGKLEVERVTFVEGRGNLIIKYRGLEGSKNICSFVGSHMDVVPADPKGWDRNPFKLIIEGDNLFGRGTTDCLGHVALLTDMMISLAEKTPDLKTTIVVVFIANEENGTFPGVGVDQLAKEGYMDDLKGGPLFWIDAADSEPCIGTCGTLQWQLIATGKLFHSGLPHKGINSIELAMDALTYIQKRFHVDFPTHPKEKEYNYVTSSTFKPTQISCAAGSLNQIPPDCTVQGDSRIVPFYDIFTVQKKLQEYAAEINVDPSIIETGAHGPHSKYTLPAEGKKGSVELKFLTAGENGVACKLDSVGYSAILSATKKVKGSVAPYSIGGSLPLIRELQDQGFDVQISGYGLSGRYHADNEMASLKDFKSACLIISTVIKELDEHA